MAEPLKAYAKPSKPERGNPHQYPLAAIEKIASDLAYAGGFPIPPVTLFTRRDAPGGEAIHHAVSAVPFASTHHWRLVRERPSLYAAIKNLAIPAMSAMMVFDTWVDCYDHRDHPDNLLFTVDAGVPLKVHFAFIDYGLSMLYAWRQASWNRNEAVPMYDASIECDPAVVSEAVGAIEKISSDLINQVVTRIPQHFLLEADQALLMEGLVGRQALLREIFRPMLGGES